MANRNSNYGKDHKKLQALTLLDGVLLVSLLNDAGNVVGSEKYCPMKLEMGSGNEASVVLTRNIDFSVGANSKIRQIKVSTVTDDWYKNIEVNIGNSPTVYTITELEVKL